jgi:hypothetical protein
MPESKSTTEEVREKLLVAIGEEVADYKNPEVLLQVAQAFALVAKGPTRGAVMV